MQKLRIPDNERAMLALQSEIQRSGEARYDHRLHGVLLVCQGLTCYETAELLDQSPRTVERWVTRFCENGFAGLQEGEHPGRPRRITQQQWDAIGRDLRRSPRDLGYGQNLWDGALLSHHLGLAYGVTLGTRQCQRLFRTMEFRRRKPRPAIAKADPAAQASYKKTPPLGKKRRS